MAYIVFFQLSSCSTARLQNRKEVKVYVSFKADENRKPYDAEVLLVKCDWCSEEEKLMLSEEALRVVKEQYFTNVNLKLKSGQSYTLPIKVKYEGESNHTIPKS